jgi:hypothetical protein
VATQFVPLTAAISIRWQFSEKEFSIQSLRVWRPHKLLSFFPPFFPAPCRLATCQCISLRYCHPQHGLWNYTAFATWSAKRPILSSPMACLIPGFADFSIASRTPIRRPNHGCHGYSRSRNSVLWVFSSRVVQHRAPTLLAGLPSARTRSLHARAPGFAIWPSYARRTLAGAKTSLKLTSQLDHSIGAGHSYFNIRRGNPLLFRQAETSL